MGVNNDYVYANMIEECCLSLTRPAEENQRVNSLAFFILRANRNPKKSISSLHLRI